MARGKRNIQRLPSARWSREEEYSLLAWLDHTIANGEVDFESTIVSHLGNRYSSQQVRYKLSKLRKDFGPAREKGQPGNWTSDIYTKGSECLCGIDGIGDETQDRIAKLKQEYGDEFAAWQLASPTRRLRSSSRQNNISPAGGKLDSSKVGKFGIPTTPRKSAKSGSLTPATIKREIESPLGRKSPAKKSRRQYEQRPPSAVSTLLSNKKLRLQNERRRLPQRTLSPVINDSEDELRHTPEREGDVKEGQSQPVRCVCGATHVALAPEAQETADYTRSSWVECTRCNVWQHILCILYSFVGGVEPDEYFCERCEPDAHKNREPQGNSLIAGDYISSSRSAKALIEEQNNNESSQTEDLQSHIAVVGAAETEEVVQRTGTVGQSLITAQERISDLKAEVWQLKLELEVRDTTITGLQREVSCLREAQKQRDSQAGIPLEKLMTETLDLQKTLRATLSTRQDGAKFAKLTATSREWFGKIKTDDGFYDMYSESQQILCQRDCENWEFLPSIVQHTKLQKLVSRCLAVELNTHSQMEEAMRELLKFTPDTVVRALATSALLQWVFESDFPQFDEESSELLKEYRSLLGSQDGAVALRNIDMAARASLTKSHAFQKKDILETANNLAIKLSQVLEPLFCKAPEANDVIWDGFATWCDDKEEWTNRKMRLIEMFKAALRMKADSCLNVEDYEMVIYPPGTKFDRTTMRTEVIAGMKNKTNSHQGRVVGLCIEAAVFAHARKELGANASVSEATATSHNFVCRNEADRARIHPRVKAVVVLAEE